MPFSKGQPLQLSEDRWWGELGDLMDSKELPIELGLLLRGLISATLNHVIPPGASAPLIRQAKEYLGGGICLGECKFFDLAVYTPDNPETHRFFFTLIPKYPHGKLKRLDEI